VSGKTVPSIAGAKDSILTRDSSSVRLGRRQSAWPRWLALLAAVASARAAAQSWWLAAPVQVPGGVVLSHTWPREHLSHTRPVVLSVMVPSPLSVKAAQAGRARAHSRPASQGRGKKRFMQHLE
jgi:hypothetical protein